MNKVTWIIFSVVSVGFLALLVLLSNNSNINVSKIDTKIVQLASKDNGKIADHVFGNSSSKVILIEYGDFQCPACSSTHNRIKPILEQYKDKIQFVFRNFTLTQIHANAKSSAGAVEAAGLQGKYWEMHNKIYESQTSWSNLNGTERDDYFKKLAKELGLNIDQFSKDIASQSVLQKISFDLSLGKKDNVEGTPTFLLNGSKMDPKIWGDDTKFKDAINTELRKAGIELPK